MSSQLVSPWTFCRSKRWVGRGLLARLQETRKRLACLLDSEKPVDFWPKGALLWFFPPPKPSSSPTQSGIQLARAGHTLAESPVTKTCLNFEELWSRPPEPGRHFFLMQAVCFHFPSLPLPRSTPGWLPGLQSWLPPAMRPQLSYPTSKYKVNAGPNQPFLPA